VTHERALAERYAERMIFLADGKLVDDCPNDLQNAQRSKVPEATGISVPEEPR
jgi:ABC-type polar amino acid transport system ATPase subunit